MRPILVHGCWAAVILLAIVVSASSQEPPQDESHKKPLVDLQGDPLPPGAIARMGTARFRHGAAIRQLQFSRDGKLLVSRGDDSTIRIWESASGTELQCLRLQRYAGCLLSPDGRFLVTHDRSRIQIWDVKTGKERQAIDAVHAAFSPDGATLAVSTADGAITLVDPATGTEVRCLAGPPGSQDGLWFSADGKTLAVLRERDDKITIAFLPVCDGGREGNLEVPFAVRNHYSSTQCFAPNLDSLACFNDSTLKVFDVSGKEPKELFTLDVQNRIYAMAYSPDGKLLASADGELAMWSVATGKVIEPAQPLTNHITAFAFAPDGVSMALAESPNGVIRIVDFKTGKYRDPPYGHSGFIEQVAVSPDGKTLASIGTDQRAFLWNLATGKEILSMDSNGSEARGSVAFAPDGRQILIGRSGKSPALFDTATGKELLTFADTNRFKPVVDFRLTPDGKCVAGLGFDGVLRFWEQRNGKELRRFPEWDGVSAPPELLAREKVADAVDAFAFSPDGKLMLTLGRDLSDTSAGHACLRVWELATFRERRKVRLLLPPHPGYRSRFRLNGEWIDDERVSVAVSPDNRFAALTSGGIISLIDLAGETEIRCFAARGEILSAAVFAPDGKTLAAGSADGSLRLWDTATGTALGAVPGHRGPITAVAFAPDGKTVITAGVDTSALVWDVGALFKLLNVKENDRPVPASQARSRVLPKNVVVDKLGDPLPAGALARLGTLRFRQGAAIEKHYYSRSEPLEYSRDGNVLVTCGTDLTIRVWDAATGKLLQAIDLPDGNELAYAISADGSCLAVYDGTGIHLWDVETGKVLRRVPDGDGRVRCLAFSPDGQTLAASSDHTEVRLINVGTGKETSRIKCQLDHGPHRLSFSADGKTLAVAVDAETILYLPLVEGVEGGRKDLEKRWRYTHLFGPDNKRLIGVDHFDVLYVFDVKGTELKGILEVDSFREGLCACSPDSKHFASGDGDKLWIWDIAAGKKLPTSIPLPSSMSGAAFSPDGKTIALAAGHSVRIVDFATGKEIQPGDGHGGIVQRLAVSPDGKTLASISDDACLVCLWDLAQRKEICRLELPGTNGRFDRPRPSALAFSPDGKILAVAWLGKGLVLYEAATGNKARTFAEDDNGKNALSIGFTADGKSIAAGSADASVHIWDLDTGKEVRGFSNRANDPGSTTGRYWFHASDGTPPDFSADGKRMVTVGRDVADEEYSVLRVRDMAYGKLLREIRLKDPFSDGTIDRTKLFQRSLAVRERPGHAGNGELAVSPNGRFCAVTTGTIYVEDAWSEFSSFNSPRARSQRHPFIIRLFDLEKGNEVRQFSAGGETLSAAVFAPDGKTLIAGASDGTLRFWDVATGTALGKVLGHRGAIWSVLVTPDGKSLITGGADTTVLIWDLPQLLNSLRVESPPLTRDQLETLVQDLAADDAARAGKAIETLAEAGNAALGTMQDRIKAVSPVDEKKLAHLVDSLASDDFAVRSRATKDLADLDELARPALEQRQADKPELEVEKRIEDLLEALEKPLTSHELLRQLRMIEVLERIATPQARTILQELSKGAEAARVTTDARRALARLARK